jgi:uncharacterized protein (TIGR02996 family)
VNDVDALLAAVLAEPDDDGPRLVYADWLEEHGQPARAEFVRVQVARAAQRPGQCIHGQCPDAAGCCEVWCEGADRLWRREGELLAAHRKRWLTEAAPPGARYWQTGTQQGWALPHVLSDGGTGLIGVPVEFRRGFVEEVRCTLADWLAHGPAVVRCQPVTRVDVTDRKPTYNSRVYLGRPAWGWWDKSQYTSRARGQSSDAEDLPENVWRQLPGRIRDDTAWAWYEFEADARAALSTALLMMVGSSSMKVTTPLSLTPR